MQCVVCGTKSIVLMEEKREYEIKGELIEINDRYYHCSFCGEEWSVTGFDFMAEVYNTYRRKFGFLMPKDIKEFRENLGLTSEEFAKLLGFSEITINRYEKGSLQERLHDNYIKMAMTTEGLAVLLESNPEAISKEKYENLKNYNTLLKKQKILIRNSK